jgi:sec-independent protein translocase protein TatB
MFDIGWTELAIVALIALLVIGPKELPATMRMIAGWIGKVRNLAREFQGGLDEMMRETELDKLKDQAQGVMYGDLDGVVENTIDPDGKIRDELDYGASYEPFGDFDEPEPETKPKGKSAAKDGEAAAAGAAAAATSESKAAAKPRAKSAAKSTKSGAKTAAKSTAKSTTRSTAKKAPAKPRAKSGATTAAKSTATRTTKAAPRKRAAKPRAADTGESDS